MPRKPNHIIGWLDIDHLRLLSGIAKEQINNALVNSNAAAIDFDDLLDEAQRLEAIQGLVKA
jgi:hypothetical protein